MCLSIMAVASAKSSIDRQFIQVDGIHDSVLIRVFTATVILGYIGTERVEYTCSPLMRWSIADGSYTCYGSYLVEWLERHR
jgi:hypothetical protein